MSIIIGCNMKSFLKHTSKKLDCLEIFSNFNNKINHYSVFREPKKKQKP